MTSRELRAFLDQARLSQRRACAALGISQDRLRRMLEGRVQAHQGGFL